MMMILCKFGSRTLGMTGVFCMSLLGGRVRKQITI